MEPQNYNNRIIKARHQLKAASCQAIIITQKPNVQYITGFTGDDSWAIITPRTSYLITDSRYSEQAHRQCPVCNIVERKKSLTDTAAQIINRQRSVKSVAIEDQTSFHTYKLLQKKLNTKTKAARNILEKIRCTKDIQEINCIRTAGRIAISALKAALQNIQPGITEADLAAGLDYNLKIRNSAPAFGTIVAFGSNASQPHYEPAGRKLKHNDTILIDFGAEYKGYKCDITRCFVIGKATKQYLHAYRTVYAAQQAAIKAIKPGVKAADVEKAARRIIAQTDFPQYGHGTGHGLGLDVHEMPVISEKIKNEKLHPGHVVTIEPGIYIPGKLGIRIEDDILITERGYKILTPDDFNQSPEPFQIQV